MIVERYTGVAKWIRREIMIGPDMFASRIEDVSSLEDGAPLWSRWWRSFLRGAKPEFEGTARGHVSIVDLFCGCGGLTLGAQEAALAVGLRPRAYLCVDIDRQALNVYKANFGPARALHSDVGSLVDFQIVGWADNARFACPPELLHNDLKALKGSVDLLVAGPPCEGHSNLNNWTRRADPRNLLYLDAVAIGIALGATAIVLENVREIVKDRSRVVETATALLEERGYRTARAVLAADELGLPQTRKRFFLAASRRGVLDLAQVARSFSKEPTTVRWAIEDLLDITVDPVLDSVTRLSEENRRRIEYLFKNDLYDLPEHERPRCHRNGHTYPSVYGRLKWDALAGTITTGFISPGRGRFIHPLRKRTLTPREAARLQGFPDWFKFSPDGEFKPGRNALAKWIGDSVPPVLGYVAVLSVLPGLLSNEG